jgi:hypothetical protein
LRFAVHGPGNPVASPRIHGVPRRDILCRVHVGVAGISASSALEDGLALARLPVHLPTCRAALAGESGFDFLYTTGSLLVQSPDEQAPSGLQDDPIKPGFLADIPTGSRPGTSGGSGHVPDLEVFDLDHVESVSDISTDLFSPVLAAVSLPCLQSSDREPYPRAAFRMVTRASKLLFEVQKSFPLPCRQPWNMKQFTRRQSRANGHTAIDPNNCSVARCRDHVRRGRECDMPSPCAVQRHTVRLRSGWDGARPAEPHPTHLRYPDFADLSAEPADVPMLESDNSEPLVPARLAPGWSPCRVIRVKEGGHDLRKIPQRLLLHHMGACGQPRVLGAGSRELPTLLQVTRCSASTCVPMGMLLNCKIPHEPSVGAMAPKGCLLAGRRDQAIPRHASTLATTSDILREVKWRCLAECRVLTPRSR